MDLSSSESGPLRLSSSLLLELTTALGKTHAHTLVAAEGSCFELRKPNGRRGGVREMGGGGRPVGRVELWRRWVSVLGRYERWGASG